MDPQFHPAMNAAYAGDLAAFREIITRTPALVTARSSCSHPPLLQFVAVDGGLGKIPRPAEFAQVLIDAGAALDAPLVAAASVNGREVLDAILGDQPGVFHSLKEPPVRYRGTTPRAGRGGERVRSRQS